MKSLLDCILLIDDNEDDNYFHQLIIEESLCAKEVKIIETGFVALDFLNESDNLPNLIFLDANMPKMNGWEFMEEYKKIIDKKPDKPVLIMLTTSLNPVDRNKASTITGLHGFEIKPLTAEKLQSILSEYFPDFITTGT